MDGFARNLNSFFCWSGTGWARCCGSTWCTWCSQTRCLFSDTVLSFFRARFFFVCGRHFTPLQSLFPSRHAAASDSRPTVYRSGRKWKMNNTSVSLLSWANWKVCTRRALVSVVNPIPSSSPLSPNLSSQTHTYIHTARKSKEDHMKTDQRQRKSGPKPNVRTNEMQFTTDDRKRRARQSRLVTSDSECVLCAGRDSVPFADERCTALLCPV